jgi:ABC-type bacteriocin/lantibiotic exporter with double-glycine peptidase domain
MNQSLIKWVIIELADKMGHKYNPIELDKANLNPEEFKAENLRDFIIRINENANRLKIVFLEHDERSEKIKLLFNEINFPILVFQKLDEDNFRPLVLYKNKGKKLVDSCVDGKTETFDFDDSILSSLISNEKGNIVYWASFSFESLVSEEEDELGEYEILHPVTRLFRLLKNEKREILYIYIYAVIIGLVSLSLPLGIQSIVSLISSGVIFNTVIFLIAFVLIGILVSGGLQIMQLTLVETLQRRIFTKAAFEFTFRVPRLKVEALVNQHVPELMNRFFDVLTIQKGLPKLLVDLSGALLQILFGLLLLAFYHPFFVFFGLGLVVILTLIFYWTGPKGLSSSIKESKYKYKVVYWLEEIARTVNSFKLAGNSNLPMKKTDATINNYLKNRSVHFGILISQYSYIILFKFFVTGGVLIIGSILVIDRQITLGMFVATEIVVILILISVEKIITYMDVIYDMLTAVDKIGHVTDLPLERYGGVRLAKNDVSEKGFSVSVKDLKYKYYGTQNYVIKGVNLEIERGERICLAGTNNAGKTTFLNILAGIYNNYEGAIAVDNISLRDFDLVSYRDHVAKNISGENIFEGTIYENVSVGQENISYQDVIWAIKSVGLDTLVQSLPDGLNTYMSSSGRIFSSSIINRFILARCIAERPKLLILTDFFHYFENSEKEVLIKFLVDRNHPWTLLVSSDDPMVIKHCDKTLLFQGGIVAGFDRHENLRENSVLKNLFLNL